MENFLILLPGFWDFVQILIVAAAIYYVLKVLARTRAIQMLIGLLVLGAMYFLARLLNLELIRYIMEKLLEYGAIAALIVFQPELRAGLARLGQNRMLRGFNRMEEGVVADELTDAVGRLARAKIGAIIAIQREISLDEYAQTGTRLQASIGSDLLVSLFSPYGPLHDGAVLIDGDTIMAAGVILPLTQFALGDKTLGTRHRAAIGLSEETDAFVVVVSEETSQISLAFRGRLERNVSLERVRLSLSGAKLQAVGSMP
ncbi:MAG TPA: diadenylate cyclase CdaA [Longimicrobiales bacterium]